MLNALENKRMTIAVILIKAIPGHEKSVYRSIKKCMGVKRLHHMFGDHDFILMLEGEGMSVLSKRMSEIRRVENILSQETVLIGEDTPWRS